jgi:hypothetical protein
MELKSTTASTRLKGCSLLVINLSLQKEASTAIRAGSLLIVESTSGAFWTYSQMAITLSLVPIDSKFNQFKVGLGFRWKIMPVLGLFTTRSLA